ncbi:His-Xaa-Ser system-associated MauG-like protein [Pseudooceanicola nitratireducens]|uniref:His-Xaa-Ser system-associated MauG-like protein n=1 Tax=Pseudooceanicola nitratireducens TaxID=517719 RepID=UPI003341E73C
MVTIGNRPVEADSLRERMLRKYALDFGMVRPEDTWIEYNLPVVEVGKKIFESTLLSSNEDTACASCHLDRFGSSDGLPTAVGVEGQSFGAKRVELGGDPQPRNALPLWGRGSKGFDVMLWDGRVERVEDGEIRSQFGDNAPSDDPLTVAAHLPPLELGEMVFDHDGANSWYQQEDVSVADAFASTILARLRRESSLIQDLAEASEMPIEEIGFIDVIAAAAHFIAYNYRIKPTQLHRFVFEGEKLSDSELRGGLLFYGSGQCTYCHNGPYFSDLSFHVIPFPQLGFGFNGFGVDYGRYNVTQDPNDLFAFRTPPLLNVSKTAPYSHSGSVPDLASAIRYHIDPLAVPLPENLRPEDRQQYARRIGLWANEYPFATRISDQDIADLIAFLGTLNYQSELPVTEIQ